METNASAYLFASGIVNPHDPFVKNAILEATESIVADKVEGERI
jgi:hypothetical protein